MEPIETLRLAADVERRRYAARSEAYAMTLSWLALANLVLVVGAALLAAFAGAAALADGRLVSKEYLALMALASTAFTIIHTKLGCEQYQNRCATLRDDYHGIAKSFDSLRFVSDEDELRNRLIALGDRVSATASSERATPFKWTVTRAEERTP